MTEFKNIIHKSLKNVMDILNKEEYKNLNSVKNLLGIYKKIVNDLSSKPHLEKKHPLIVLEGLDGCGKSTTSKRLSKRLSAVVFITPPESIRSIRSLFDDENEELRSAYYSLGNYIAALEMKPILAEKPVILDRYWHSTAAFAIAQTVANDPKQYLPKSDDEIYKWPDDLLKPDVVIFLSVSENVRLQRIHRRAEYTAQEILLKDQTEFRSKVLTAYNNMRNPGIVIVDSSRSKRKVEDTIISKISSLLLTDEMSSLKISDA